MSRFRFKACGFALMAIAGAIGLAQTPQATAQTTLSLEGAAAVAAAVASGVALPTKAPAGIEVQRSSGGARFISGGAGFSERAAMDAKRSEFPLKLVLSAAQGEYIVADSIRLMSSKLEVLSAQTVGPLVMIDVPSGSYTLEVSYKGKVRRQAIKLGKQARQVNIRFPG